MAHSKNLSHLCSTGDILCNVDADNFIGEGFTKFISDNHKKMGDSLLMRHSTSHRKKYNLEIPKDGASGRIITTRNLFKKVGGYDESYSHYGGDDRDFYTRCQTKVGFKSVHIPTKFLNVIEHEHSKRTENYSNEDKKSSNFYLHSSKLEKRLFKIRTGKIFGFLKPKGNFKEFGSGEVFINFSKEPTEVSSHLDNTQNQWNR